VWRWRFATQTRWQAYSCPIAAGGLGMPLLIIEGGATLRGIGIFYRSVLLPLWEDGIAINYVMGAANHRSLRGEKEIWARAVFETHWL